MKRPFLGLTAIAMLMGCATARNVQTKPGKGGVVAVHQGLWGDARAEADNIMRTTCKGKPFEIVEEGETVIGSTTTANTKREGEHEGLFGKEAESERTTAQTMDKTEWRVKYVCKGAEAAPAKKKKSKKTS
jgi:hypothetical protein